MRSDREERIKERAYAIWLAEGRVEKLQIAEELDRAIDEVFPPAAGFGVQVKRYVDHRQAGVEVAEAGPVGQ